MTHSNDASPADDSMNAADFNFWCAVNSKPFRLIRHEWPDGSIEWDIEVFPGRPEATIAYGTAQTNEALAAAAAFAFIAGVEWGESFARPDGESWSDDEDEIAAPPPVMAETAVPTPPVPAQTGGVRAPYRLPAVGLLQPPPPKAHVGEDEGALATNARMLETVLRNFKVRGEIMEVHQGPVVTLYEFEPLPGTKSSTVINLADDIARSMRSITTRIAIVPGRSVIGIELPNALRETVYLREILESPAFTEFNGRLPLALGKDIAGEPVVADLARMPHLLIAGTTG
ncbi:MAG: DNA translocase FtsK, partial [Magnetospirillum sp.]|nr:DNA translocase FtsK [Magnetospirillum sp.]